MCDDVAAVDAVAVSETKAVALCEAVPDAMCDGVVAVDAVGVGGADGDVLDDAVEDASERVPVGLGLSESNTDGAAVGDDGSDCDELDDAVEDASEREPVGLVLCERASDGDAVVLSDCVADGDTDGTPSCTSADTGVTALMNPVCSGTAQPAPAAGSAYIKRPTDALVLYVPLTV